MLGEQENMLNLFILLCTACQKGKLIKKQWEWAAYWYLQSPYKGFFNSSWFQEEKKISSERNTTENFYYCKIHGIWHFTIQIIRKIFFYFCLQNNVLLYFKAIIKKLFSREFLIMSPETDTGSLQDLLDPLVRNISTHWQWLLSFSTNHSWL